jgi:hypothetical protein
MATMTAKGVPTAQATTQLRQLFVDLSKAGGKTAKVFEETAGKSFQEFIAAGGDTADDEMMVQDPSSGLVFAIRSYKGYRKAMFEVAAVWGKKCWKPDFVSTILG